jgi:hypothetical protein
LGCNLGQPEQKYEQIAEAYRDLIQQQLANVEIDAVIMAERDFGHWHQVEKELRNHFEQAALMQPPKLVSYHKNIGYMASVAQLLDIGHACLMMRESAPEIKTVLIYGQGLSGGISAVIVRGN